MTNEKVLLQNTSHSVNPFPQNSTAIGRKTGRSNTKRSLLTLFFLFVWLLFLTKGSIYSSITPIWEGIDELFHFAYVQVLSATQTLPVWGKTVVDNDIAQSTAYVPLPPLMPQLVPGFEKLSYSKYWQLSPEKRQQYSEHLRALTARSDAITPSSSPLYQAQHPPLYYTLCEPVYRMADSLSLPDKVYLLRLYSVFLASFAFLAAFLLSRKHALLGAGTALLMVSCPVFYTDVARIGNDSLSVVVFSFIFFAMVSYFDRRTLSRAFFIALLLGLGLLTKAYFLTAIPAIALFLLFVAFRHTGERKGILIHGCIILLGATALAGWWYIRNYLLYGTFSGLQESIYFPTVGLLERIRAVFEVNWILHLKHLFVTFSWVNGWSFVYLPKAAYVVFAVLFGAGIAGILKYSSPKEWKNGQEPEQLHSLVAAVSLLLFFALGIAYHQINVQATVKVIGGPGGWYLYALILPISYLLAAGLLKLSGKYACWTFGIFAVALALTEVVGFLRVLLPYYSGTAVPAASGWGVNPVLKRIALAQELARVLSDKPSFLTPPLIGLLATACVLFYTTLLLLFFGLDGKAEQPIQRKENAASE